MVEGTNLKLNLSWTSSFMIQCIGPTCQSTFCLLRELESFHRRRNHNPSGCLFPKEILSYRKYIWLLLLLQLHNSKFFQNQGGTGMTRQSIHKDMQTQTSLFFMRFWSSIILLPNLGKSCSGLNRLAKIKQLREKCKSSLATKELFSIFLETRILPQDNYECLLSCLLQQFGSLCVSVAQTQRYLKVTKNHAKLDLVMGT